MTLFALPGLLIPIQTNLLSDGGELPMKYSGQR